MVEKLNKGPTPKISVIMPVHNQNPEYLQKSIQSVLAQRLTEYELIIVEDPSARSARHVVKSINDSRVRHIVNPQRVGLVEQRNQGLTMARFKYIAMMDSDDISHPFRFIKQVNFLKRNPEVDVLGSQVLVIDGKDSIVGYRCYPVSHDDILYAMPRYVPIPQPAVMMRREVIDSFGGYQSISHGVAEDYAYWSRLIQSGVRFANHPENLCYYRIHDMQLKHIKLRETISAILNIKKLYWSDHSNTQARIQLYCERLLLRMPIHIVSWMLLKMLWHYRPGSTCAKCINEASLQTSEIRITR